MPPVLTPEQRKQQQEEAVEQDMLLKLSTMARGLDPVHLTPITPAAMMAAQKQYHDLKHQIDQRRFAREKLAQEAELEHRKLDIEVEKVQVQKAEVMVRALEVAANAGVSPDQLLHAIQDFGRNLMGSSMLPGPASSPALLEKKSDK